MPLLQKSAGSERPAGVVSVAGPSAGHFALLFAALIFAAFPQVLLGLETFVVRDFGFFAYPLAAFQKECFWRGEWPLWNPYNHCGVPFLAQWNTMPLYPPALIYLLLPLKWSLGFFSLAHLFWAGLGMYFLARRWTGNNLSAAIAGLIFGFNGFSLNLLMWPSHIATFSWMPWVIWAAERGWQKGGRALIAAVFVGALQMLGGGPETVFFTWLICLAIWAVRVCGLSKPRRHLAENAESREHSSSTESDRASSGPWSVFWRFPAMVLLVTGICAVQLFPFLDLVAHSQRETGYADARWSMPSWGWANLFVPMVFGTSGKQGLFFQYGQYWTSSYYLGVPALLLALMALRRKGGFTLWLPVVAALLGLVLATGDQTLLSRWARQVVPQLSLMTYPVKFITLTVLAVPLLAALGMERLQAHDAKGTTHQRLILFTAALLALIGGILVWAWKAPFPTDNFPATWRNGLTRAAFLFLAGLGFLVVCAPKSQILERLKFPSSALWVILPLILWLDVWTHEPPQNPVVPAWVFEPNLARQKLQFDPQPALGESRVMLSSATAAKFMGLVLDDPKDNYLVKRLGLFADCNVLDGMPKVDGFFSLTPKECGELNSAIYVSKVPCGEGLLDFLSVSQLGASEEEVKWSARQTWLPLVTAGKQPLFIDDTNSLRLLLSSQFDPRKFALLPLESRGAVNVASNSNVRVRISRFSAQKIELEVESEAAALVTVAQSFYHPWRAYIDEKPQPLLRANYAFQGLQVQAGKHKVRLQYVDQAFRTGSLVSGLACAGCAGGWVALGKKRRRASEPKPISE